MHLKMNKETSNHNGNEEMQTTQKMATQHCKNV